MNYKEQTTGGGPAVGLAGDFTKFLQGLITSGSFGGGTSGQQAAGGPQQAQDQSQNMFGALNSILQGPNAGLQTSVQDLISRQRTSDVNDLRARFGAQGNMAYGTGAAHAEGLYRAEAAPREALAMDEINRNNKQTQLQMLIPILQMAMGISGKGISQAETTLQAPGWMQGFNMLMDVANTAANFIPGGGGGDTDTRSLNNIPTSRASMAPTASYFAPPSITQPASQIGTRNPFWFYNPNQYNFGSPRT